MTKLRKLAVVAGAMLVLSVVALLTPAGRAIAQNVKPLLVQVMNDSTTPVPVVGTVGLNTAASGPIPVTGTVAISPTGNAVRAAPRGTRLVFDSGPRSPTGLGSISVDISGSTKVHVYAHHVAFTEPVGFVIAAQVPGGRINIAGENDLDFGQGRDYIFELASTHLDLAVTGSGQARFVVFGD
jgi:hypothetical protein